MSDDTPHNFYYDTSAQKIDVPWTAAQLRETYFWGGRTEEDLITQIRNSLVVIGVYRRDYISVPSYPSHRDHQVGFARVVSDGVQFGWIADFLICETERKKGLGHRLMDIIVEHHLLKGVTLNLGTKDAAAFYSRFGFCDATHMMRRPVA